MSTIYEQLVNTLRDSNDAKFTDLTVDKFLKLTRKELEKMLDDIWVSAGLNRDTKQKCADQVVIRRGVLSSPGICTR